MNKAQQTNMALSEALQNAKDTFLLRTELFHAFAVETKAKYDAFVSVGFSEQQALELCKSKVL